MADNGAGLDSIAAEVIKLTGEVREMRGELKGLVDHKLAAAQRVEIRAETERMIARDVAALGKEVESARQADRAEVLAEAMEYTDRRIEKLEKALSDRQAREEKVSSDVRRTMAMSASVGIAGILYALYNLLKSGGV